MNQIELEPETRGALDRIRHRSNVLSIFEMPADLAEAAVWGRPRCARGAKFQYVACAGVAEALK